MYPKSLGGTANDIDSFKSGIFYIKIQQPGKVLRNHPNQGNLNNKTFNGLIQKYGEAAKSETGTNGANGDIRAYIANNPTLVTDSNNITKNFTDAGFVSNGITDFVLNVPTIGSVGTTISTLNASTITNNGTGPFTYLWTISPSDAGFTNTTTFNPSFTPSTATTYNLTAKVTDSKGANITKSSSITVNSPIYTKTLFHFDGNSNDTMSNHTLALSGATIDTTGKFGPGSLKSTTKGQYATISGGTDFNFGTGDFTIDFQMYSTASSAKNTLKNATLGTEEDTPTGNTGAKQVWISGDGAPTTYWGMGYSNEANTYGTYMINLQNAWHHMAIVRYGTNLGLYIDGTKRINVTLPANFNFSGSNAFALFGNGSTSRSGTGWIDEFRVSKGIARWTSDFTAPTVAYTSPY